MDLQKKIAVITDKFLVDIEHLYEDARLTLKQAEDEKLEAEKSRVLIRQQEVKADEVLKKIKDDLALEKDKTLKLQKDLDGELTKQTSVNNALSLKLKQAEIDRKETEELKKLADAELEKKRKASEDFKKKTELLKEDFAKLEGLKKDLVDREDRLRLKDKNLLDKEETLIGKEYDLASRELKLAIDEKRIKQEWMRLNAKK